MKSLEGVAYLPKNNEEFIIAIKLLLALDYLIYNEKSCLQDGLVGWEYLVFDDDGLCRSAIGRETTLEGLEELIIFLFTEEESEAQKGLKKLQQQIEELQNQASVLEGKL